MKPFGAPNVAMEALYAAGSHDPESSRIGREGLDRNTIDHFITLISHPDVADWFRPLADRGVTEDQIVVLIHQLSEGPGVFDVSPVPDLAGYVAWIAARNRPHGEIASAFAGLLAVAFLEGLARRHRPTAAYPYLASRSIEQVVLPVADLLAAAGFLAGAAMLCTLMRSYTLADPFQRQSEPGQRVLARCRRIQHAYTHESRVACQEAAWALREWAERDAVGRASLATLFHATGDAVRAYAIARRDHLPAVPVVMDLVEISIDLAPADPLLQAVWTKFVLPYDGPALPERVRLPMRMRRRDVNSAFKGLTSANPELGLIDLSEAYAVMLFGFVTGLWEDKEYESQAWSTILHALKLPVAWSYYPGGYLRILDLYNLAVDTGSQLPALDHVFSLSGWPRSVGNDIREAASASLSMDGHTGHRGRNGRSLAYDSSFVLEPWRRGEDAVASVNALEKHRAAGISYWLRVVPPFTPRARGRKERKIVERDVQLTEEYQALIGALTIGQGAVHHRIYGFGQHRRVLHFDQGEHAMRLNQWVEEHAEWHEQALRDFPSYALLRSQPPWTVDHVQQFLRTGIPI